MDEIAVMDYCSGELFIYTLPRPTMTSDQIEDWLDSLGFRVNDCYYMVSPNITVNDER